MNDSKKISNGVKMKILSIKPPRWLQIYFVLGLIVHFLSPKGTLLFVPFTILGGIVFVAGFFVMMWAWALFRKAKTGVCPLSQETTHFVTNGPYAFSRNPMYLGMAGLIVGVALFLSSAALAIAAVAFFVTINNGYIPFEEAKMKKQFGQQFAEYRNKVRRWL